MEHPTETLATKINKARKLGEAAYHNGESPIPVLSKGIWDLTAGLAVGQGAAKIYLAFSSAWHTANLAAPLPS